MWAYLFGNLFNSFLNLSPNFSLLSHTNSNVYNEAVIFLIKSRPILENIDERSRAWRGDAQLDVVSPVHDVL